MLSDTVVAEVCYAAQRKLADRVREGYPLPAWERVPEWLRDLYVEAVRLARMGHQAQQLHAYWREVWTEHGWVYGPVRNPDACPPTHPSLTEWQELPPYSRVQLTLFVGMVVYLTLGLPITEVDSRFSPV